MTWCELVNALQTNIDCRMIRSGPLTAVHSAESYKSSVQWFQWKHRGVVPTRYERGKDQTHINPKSSIYLYRDLWFTVVNSISPTPLFPLDRGLCSFSFQTSTLLTLD